MLGKSATSAHHVAWYHRGSFRGRLPWSEVLHDLRTVHAGPVRLHPLRLLQPVRQALRGAGLDILIPRLVPNHIAGFAVMYGFFLAFGELGPGSG